MLWVCQQLRSLKVVLAENLGLVLRIPHGARPLRLGFLRLESRTLLGGQLSLSSNSVASRGFRER